MADNVSVANGGTPFTAATDDVGGVHYQYVKLATSTTDSAEPIGDTDNGATRSLHVDPRPNLLLQSQSSAGLTTATTNYAVGDVVGSGWTFTNMARESGGTGKVVGLKVIDKADVLSVVDLYFASGSITFGTDNAAPSISDTDAEKLLNVQTVALEDLGGVRFGALNTAVIPYTCDATSLYVYAVTRVANNFFAATSDVHIQLAYERA